MWQRWAQPIVERTFAIRPSVVRIPILLSVVNLAISIVAQFVTPRVLQRVWGDHGYEGAIGLLGLAGYVAVADAGIQAYLTRRLALLHEEGRFGALSGIVRAGLRALLFLGSAFGVLVVLVGLATGRANDGPDRTLALVVTTVSGTAALAFGGFSTAVECGLERYTRCQIANFFRGLLAGLGLPVLALSGATPMRALAFYGVATLAFDLTRFASAYSLVPRLTGEAISIRSILWDSRGSFFLTFAGPTQNGLLPFVASRLVEGAIAVAVPTRTLANGARLLTTAVSNTLWVPLARELQSRSAEGTRSWAQASLRVAALQMGAIAIVMIATPIVVPVWLPAKHLQIVNIIDYFLLEQAVFVCTAPTFLLLQAGGKFARVATVQVTGAVLSVLLALVWVPSMAARGFALASCVGSGFAMLPVALAFEAVYLREIGGRAAAVLGPRVALMCVALGCIAVHRYAQIPALVVIFLSAAFCAWSPWQRGTAAAPDEPRGDKQ